jgi:hypothetical protein
MKYFLTLILCFTAFAVNPVNASNTPDHRICDGDGHCLDIAADGSVYISTAVEVPIITSGSHDIRVSDADGHVLDIRSDGAVTIKVQ